MAQGQYDQAAALLDGWKGPADWQAYARFNLGVALLRSGKTAQGEQQLDAVGQLAGDSEELLALRDKANLALGYILLQNKDAARAGIIWNAYACKDRFPIRRCSLSVGGLRTG